MENLHSNLPGDIQTYHLEQTPGDLPICEALALVITENLPEAEGMVWHAHPVWFLNGNPIVGYSKQKQGIRLMFWSGADFEEPALNVVGKKFKDASIFYQSVDEISVSDLQRWLEKSRTIQWDYKNLIKRKGRLERVGGV